ncbi:dihydrolipoamide acetyltransferase [Cycloclasticus sp. 46_120_T64]|nr:dihydrolipoamide acetyltransferase [Cycloclasticus sp. 46_120_T64]
MSKVIDIVLPDIGSTEGAELVEILVAVGDAVELEQALLSLESDKASMEIPASTAGTVAEILVNIGDKLNEGVVVMRLEVADEKKDVGPASVAVANEATAATKPEDIKIYAPDMGDVESAEVVEVAVAVGDLVEKEQALLSLESDKASMEIPSTARGVVTAIDVAVGDKLAEGDLIVTISGQNDIEVTQPEPVAIKPVRQDKLLETPVKAIPNTAKSTGHIHASPAVRKFARELGVALSTVTIATGPKGRLLKDDIKNHVKKVIAGAASTAAGSGIPPIPSIDFTKFGEIEEKPLSKIKRLTGANLSRAWLNVPMVTHHDLADITEMEAFRKSLKVDADKQGVKVTFLAFIMKALVAALKQFPQFNASLSADGKSLIYKKYFNIGIAVATPNGLVVPVFKDVDTTSIFELAEQMETVSKQARDGKLSAAQMQGACMTISSLGGIGGTAFTPIVNAPEVAILGVTRGQIQPVWDGVEFQPRLMLPLDMTYDHRVIDGADAAAFMVALASYLNDIRRVLL